MPSTSTAYQFLENYLPKRTIGNSQEIAPGFSMSDYQQANPAWNGNVDEWRQWAVDKYAQQFGGVQGLINAINTQRGVTPGSREAFQLNNGNVSYLSDADNNSFSSQYGWLVPVAAFAAPALAGAAGLTGGAAASGGAAGTGAFDLGIGGVGEAMGLGAGYTSPALGAAAGAAGTGAFDAGVGGVGEAMGLGAGYTSPALTNSVIQAVQAGNSASTIGRMLGISDSLVNTIAGVAGPAIGALLQSNSAHDAASAQQEATNAAVAEQRRQYDLNRSDLAPWRTAGTSAINDLSSQIAPGGALTKKFTTEDFYADPVNQLGFQFGLDEGLKQLRRSAPGMRNSGPMLKAITKYATDYTGSKAADSYGRFVNDQTNIYNRLAGVAGTGQNAVGTGVTAGSNTANNVSNLISNQGNATGAANIAAGNAYGQAFNTIGNYFTQQNTLDRLLSSGMNLYGNRTYGT